MYGMYITDIMNMDPKKCSKIKIPESMKTKVSLGTFNGSSNYNDIQGMDGFRHLIKNESM